MGKCSFQAALDVSNDSDKQHFLDNVEHSNCSIDSQMLDLIKYASIYSKMDCKVLTDGYCVFRSWMLEHTVFDVDRFITIQSLAFAFMLRCGCYDNVFQASGVLQQFISRCVVGGRVMWNLSLMYHVKHKTADCDACSL